MTPAPQLSDMIETVRADARSEDPLAQLGTAARTATEITELSDQLLGYFVENARAQGRSWIEISETLGVSKQAVHKRFAVAPGWMPRMERFTPRAKECVEASAPAATQLRHPYVGTEHLLLGLYAAPGNLAERVLRSAGITRDTVEQHILDRVGRGEDPVPDKLPFTPRAMRLLERTLQHALEWGHNYIGTEHLLVAMYGDDGGDSEDGGMAQQILVENELSRETVEATVIELLSGYTETN